MWVLSALELELSVTSVAFPPADPEGASGRAVLTLPASPQCRPPTCLSFWGILFICVLFCAPHALRPHFALREGCFVLLVIPGPGPRPPSFCLLSGRR